MKVASEANFVYIYFTGEWRNLFARDKRTIWCHLSVTSGITAHSGKSTQKGMGTFQ